MEPVQINDQEEEQPQPQERRYKGNHPVAAFFHVCWKAGAVILYLLYSSHFTVTFVLVTLFSAADFWTVKNVTGRLMVALRWWNEVDDKGDNIWHFESGNQSDVNPYDSKFFWMVLIGYEVFWLLMLLMSVFNLHIQWTPLVLVVVFINGANLLGYFKCRKDAKAHAQEYIKAGLMSGLAAGLKFASNQKQSGGNNQQQQGGSSNSGGHQQPQQQRAPSGGGAHSQQQHHHAHAEPYSSDTFTTYSAPPVSFQPPTASEVGASPNPFIPTPPKNMTQQMYDVCSV